MKYLMPAPGTEPGMTAKESIVFKLLLGHRVVEWVEFRKRGRAGEFSGTLAIIRWTRRQKDNGIMKRFNNGRESETISKRRQ
jgi:hypothetical protein